MTSLERKNWIKAEAISLGFCFMGVTTADPIPEAMGKFVDWLERERHGEMAYLARADTLAKRADPRLLLPEARSVLVFGTRVPTFDREGSLLMADYARMVDYHLTIPPILDGLLARYRERFFPPGSGTNADVLRYRICVDAAPVLERAYAVRAGCGWIGRSSQLIHPVFGPKVILAIVLLSDGLPPDTMLPGSPCGDCHRCVEACPGGCIDGDRCEIDARRCVSYLTTERKSELDASERSLVGRSVFGCDVCTDVCPWAKKALAADATREFRTVLVQNPGAMPAVTDVDLDHEGFKTKYADSPILRRKRDRWVKRIGEVGRTEGG